MPAPRLKMETVTKLDSLVQQFVESGWVVGAELMIVHGNKTVCHEVYGWRDQEESSRMEPNSLYNIRSMTKPLVGSIAQRLVDRGQMKLTDRVLKYLPSFENDAAGEITIEHLLTHRSGLPDGHPKGRPSDYPTLRSIADYWGKVGSSLSPPGEAFHYSDPGADVLGAVLEVASGLPLAELAQRELLEPLGMSETHAVITKELSEDLRYVSVYQPNGDGSWSKRWQPGDGCRVPFAIGSGQTWYSTPADYARFLEAWLHGGLHEGQRWLSDAAVRRALIPQSRMDYPSAIPSTRVFYGQMWQLFMKEGTEAESTGRVPRFGHSGSDGTYAWVFPAHDLIILYFTQSRGQRTRMYLEQQFDDLFEDQAPSGLRGEG